MNRRGFLSVLSALSLIPTLKQESTTTQLTPDLLSDYFSEMEKRGFIVETVILSAIDTAPLFRKEFVGHFDRVTHREQFRVLRIGHIWGADVRVSKRLVRPMTAERSGEILLIGWIPQLPPDRVPRQQVSFTIGNFDGRESVVPLSLERALVGDPYSATIDELLEA